MAVLLSGGCRVAELKEGTPIRDGALTVWSHFAGKIALRVLELDGHASLRNDAADEVLYVIEGGGRAEGKTVKVDDGIYVPPGAALEIDGTMTLVSAICPADGGGPSIGIVSMEDCPVQRTGDRWYRETLHSDQVTQFVGAIPPGRAPDHFHLYEEVIVILDGTGVMWAGTSHTPIEAGSCIFLPRKQLHCVENTGTGELRLLGVFYPAGSPAVRYGANTP